MMVTTEQETTTQQGHPPVRGGVDAAGGVRDPGVWRELKGSQGIGVLNSKMIDRVLF